MFVGLAGDRCEALLSSPSSTPFQHLRCMALLGGILAHVCGWMADYVTVLQGEQARLSSAVLWLFDGATIIVEATHGIIKYGELGGERVDIWAAWSHHGFAIGLFRALVHSCVWASEGFKLWFQHETSVCN